MDEIEAVRQALRDLGRKHWRMVSAATGVKFKALSKFAYGETKEPRASTLLALQKYLGPSKQKAA